jgi:surface antigen
MMSVKKISWKIFGPVGLFAAVALVIAQPAQAQSSYGIERGTCDRASLSHSFDSSTNNVVGSLLGAAAGGLLGSQFGHGSGKSIMTIAGVLGGALAGGAIGRSMERPDAACVNQTLESGPTGQTVAWQNPDNGTTYNVTPTRTYQDEGRPCRDYTTTAVIDGQTQTLHGTACRQDDGSWKAADSGGQ